MGMLWLDWLQTTCWALESSVLTSDKCWTITVCAGYLSGHHSVGIELFGDKDPETIWNSWPADAREEYHYLQCICFLSGKHVFIFFAVENFSCWHPIHTSIPWTFFQLDLMYFLLCHLGRSRDKFFLSIDWFVWLT